jgi:RNA polymerase sigma factor (TIGR02999 family)
LVHEAYLKLVDQTRIRWQDRTHFFAVAATSMRRILINHARDRARLKRGGGAKRAPLSELTTPGTMSDQALLDLDEALTKLGELDERKARVVEHRYFAGLGVDETAELLGVSPATVKRDWEFARAWLLRAMTDDEESRRDGA